MGDQQAPIGEVFYIEGAIKKLQVGQRGFNTVYLSEGAEKVH